jgi:hypothetical protein
LFQIPATPFFGFFIFSQKTFTKACFIGVSGIRFLAGLLRYAAGNSVLR